MIAVIAFWDFIVVYLILLTVIHEEDAPWTRYLIAYWDDHGGQEMMV